jgi:hypothetical protein
VFTYRQHLTQHAGGTGGGGGGRGGGQERGYGVEGPGQVWREKGRTGVTRDRVRRGVIRVSGGGGARQLDRTGMVGTGWGRAKDRSDRDTVIRGAKRERGARCGSGQDRSGEGRVGSSTGQE